jgi:hypothetical protein
MRVLALLGLATWAAVAQQTSTKPITENGLIDALKIGGLSQAELMTQVRTRGVTFVVTPGVEQDLRSAGASPTLIDVVRQNQPQDGAQAAAPEPGPVGHNFVSPSPAPPNPNLTLHSVHKLYIERMPNGLDDFLRTAIFKKCGSFFTIVLNRPEADAILKVNDPRLPGNVVMVDQSGSIILWSGSADKKEAKFLDLRKGGEKVLAEKLAGQLNKAIQ